MRYTFSSLVSRSSFAAANAPIILSLAFLTASGYDTGEIRIFLGDQALTADARSQSMYVVVYDADNEDGVVWGPAVPVVVKAEVEN